jgi:hypothetical protein
VEWVLLWFDSFYPEELNLVPILSIFLEIFFRRHVRRLQFPLEQVIEIYILEKSMCLNVFCSCLKISKSFRQVSPQQMLDQRFEVGIKTIRVLWLGIYDLLVNVHGIIVLKWRVTCEHFVHKDAEGPPVDWLSMTLI